MRRSTLSLTELKQLRTEHLDNAKEILDLAKSEDRDLTVSEKARVDAEIATVEEIDKTDLPRAQRIHDAAQRRANGGPRFSDYGTPPSIPLDTEIYEDEHMSRIKSLPRHMPVKNFRGIIHDKPAEERAYEFGHWMLAQVSRHCPRHMGHFSQSEQICRERGILNVAQTNVNSDAGVFVPEQFGTDLVILREEFGVARRIAEVIPMDSDTRTDPKWTSGLTASWTGESDAITESDATWESLRLVAKDLAVITRMSAQLSADAAISYGDTLIREISYAFATAEDAAIFNGTGLSTDGGIIGLRTKLQDVDLAGTDSFGLVTQATGTTWAAITIDDFHEVLAACPAYSLSRRPQWVCSTNFFHSVMVPLAVAQAGGATIAGIGQMVNGVLVTAQFLGYPVVFSQSYPTATAVTTVVCTFGDHSLGIRLGDRQQESIMFSEHATVGGQSVFERNQIAVRGTERIDAVVHGAGNKAATESGPIVGLQTGT